jgi:hypothetical protein
MELDKLKGDLMNAPTRWQEISADAIAAECRTLRMRGDDADELASRCRAATTVRSSW